MADFSKLIDQRDDAAQYMIDEITHICRDLPKRDPGSEGEKLACEYMEGVLKKDCGCEHTLIEHFEEHPGSFFGWIYFTITFAILGQILYFFLPLLGAIFTTLGFTLMFFQFGLYKKVVDFLFPKKIGTNVTAIKKCTGEVKARVFFNGHPDAAWNWPVNNKWGGTAHVAHIVISVGGALYSLIITIIACILLGIEPTVATPESYGVMFWLGISALIFVPFQIGMYFMWDERTIVDGANDNLTGCYMGIAILRAMQEQGIELEHTEVGVILSGSEEAGLRGAKAWCEAHKDDYRDVPTWIYSYDTIHDAKFLMVNYRDLNGTVKVDQEVSDSFMASAKELGIPVQKGWVPPFGGATDSAAFAQAGFKATGVTALNHNLEDYYHTLRDTYDNLDKDCLAKCYAISVKCLENFDKKFAK